MQTTERTDQITKIIVQRRPLVKRIEAVQENMERLDEALKALSEERDRLSNAAYGAAMSGRLKGLAFSAARERIAHELTSLRKLKARFARDTINFGVIGMAGQGKSCLLQALSGLDTTVIPSSRGLGDCTAVRSTIHHEPEMNSYALVTFYTEEEFLIDVIKPYYDYLELGATPLNLRDFRNNDLPALKFGDSIYTKKYKHLTDAKLHLETCADRLGLPPTQIEISQVAFHVTQNSEDEKHRYLYLAVQDVKIFCRFPHEDVGRIALIDMPGIGNTTMGDKERMINILGQDVDTVLFVKRPDHTRDSWNQEDVELYSTARSALRDLPIEKWSFLIINNDGLNTEVCGLMQEYMQSDSVHQKEFINSMVVNCADAHQVSSDIVNPMLTYLAENIKDLDAQYAQACQGRLLQIQREVSALIGEANGALGRGEAVDDIIKQFEYVFNPLWDDLQGGLQRLRADLNAASVDPNGQLAKKVEDCFEKARHDEDFPTLEQIAKQISQSNSRLVFARSLDLVRTNLTKHFLPVEETLSVSLEGVRCRVADVLKKHGRLAPLSSTGGTAFLREVAAMIPKELEELKVPFDSLSSVELTYRGFLQYRMRQHLSDLYPDTCQTNPAPTAQSVLEVLQVQFDTAVYSLESAFNTWLREPNQVAAAIVEEFVDDVLRTKNARNLWWEFYLQMRGQIWQAEFDKIGERSHLRQSWDVLVTRASNANKLSAFEFIP